MSRQRDPAIARLRDVILASSTKKEAKGPAQKMEFHNSSVFIYDLSGATLHNCDFGEAGAKIRHLLSGGDIGEGSIN